MIPKHLGDPVGIQTYFITTSTYQKRSIFQVENWARVFFQNLCKHRRSGAYLLHHFVLMPNHLHLLISPLGEVTLEKAMQYIKGGAAHALKEAGRVGCPVWQRGYTDRRVRSSAEYQKFVEYIFQNPVKAGLVQQPEDYPYCSAYPGWKLDPPRPYLSG